MGVPTSEVGYTSAMPRREDHEVHKRICGGIGEKKSSVIRTTVGIRMLQNDRNMLLHLNVAENIVFICCLLNDATVAQIVWCW